MQFSQIHVFMPKVHQGWIVFILVLAIFRGFVQADNSTLPLASNSLKNEWYTAVSEDCETTTTPIFKPTATTTGTASPIVTSFPTSTACVPLTPGIVVPQSVSVDQTAPSGNNQIVSLRLSYINYLQLAANVQMRNQLAAAAADFVAGSLFIGSDMIQVTSFQDGEQIVTSSHSEKKIQSCHIAGVIVTMYVPSDQTSYLQTLVKNPGSRMHSSQLGPLALLLDSSYYSQGTQTAFTSLSTTATTTTTPTTTTTTTTASTSTTTNSSVFITTTTATTTTAGSGTSPTGNSSSTGNGSGSSGQATLSTGAIAGIVSGIAVVVILGISFQVYNHYRSKNSNGPSPYSMTSADMLEEQGQNPMHISAPVRNTTFSSIRSSETSF